MPNKSITAVAPYGAAYTGLTLGYTVYNLDGSSQQAHTTTAVHELGATGIYVVAYSVAFGTAGVIVWDAPTGLDPYVNPFDVAALDGVVEGSVTHAHALQRILAAEAGKRDGAGTTTQHFRDQADTKNRITATLDASGNRTAMTYSDD